MQIIQNVANCHKILSYNSRAELDSLKPVAAHALIAKLPRLPLIIHPLQGLSFYRVVKGTDRKFSFLIFCPEYLDNREYR